MNLQLKSLAILRLSYFLDLFQEHLFKLTFP